MSGDFQFPFEKLRVGQEARAWIRDVYTATRLFPADERFGPISQLNRAAVSVAANLAEGSARTSRKDQAHFYQQAYSSAMECMCLLILATDQNYIATSALAAHRETISRRMHREIGRAYFEPNPPATPFRGPCSSCG